jgi:hypothetical protein
MACACAAGNWTTGKVTTNTVNTENVKTFLGMKSKYADDDTAGFYPNPKVTDDGVERNATWSNLAAVAVATLTTLAAIEIAQKQYDIAVAYYKIAQQKWDRFKNLYMPCERTEMNEACNTPEYTALYDSSASTWMNEVAANFGLAGARIDRLNALNCVCPDPSLAQDIALMTSMAAGDTGNFAYRYEEHRKIAKDDIRWTRRQQALNRGRDLQTTAAKYAEAAANAYGDLGNTVGQVAEGAMSAIGYFSNRNDTSYPQRQQLQRPANQFTGGAFIGAQPENGEYGFINHDPLNISTQIDNYGNSFTPYTTNSAITSVAGSQQPSSSGG